MLTAGTMAEPVADADADAGVDEADVAGELDEDEQAAAIRARAAARATQLSRGRRRDLPSPCIRKCRPPLLLLLTRIPTPFRTKIPE